MTFELVRARSRTPTALAATLALVLCLSSSAGWSAPAESSAPSSVSSVAIPVEGMTCASCAAQVKRALRAIDGVADVEVSLEHRNARVRYVADKVDLEDLVSAINRLGYKAGAPMVEDSTP